MYSWDFLSAETWVGCVGPPTPTDLGKGNAEYVGWGVVLNPDRGFVVPIPLVKPDVVPIVGCVVNFPNEGVDWGPPAPMLVVPKENWLPLSLNIIPDDPPNPGVVVWEVPPNPGVVVVVVPPNPVVTPVVPPKPGVVVPVNPVPVVVPKGLSVVPPVVPVVVPPIPVPLPNAGLVVVVPTPVPNPPIPVPVCPVPVVPKAPVPPPIPVPVPNPVPVPVPKGLVSPVDGFVEVPPVAIH